MISDIVKFLLNVNLYYCIKTAATTINATPTIFAQKTTFAHLHDPFPSKYAIKANIMEEIDKFAAKLGLSRSAIIAMGMQSYMKSI